MRFRQLSTLQITKPPPMNLITSHLVSFFIAFFIDPYTFLLDEAATGKTAYKPQTTRKGLCSSISAYAVTSSCLSVIPSIYPVIGHLKI